MNNTLISSPLSTVLEALFAEASHSVAAVRQEMGKLSPEERAAMMASKTDYRAFYERAKDFLLAVSRETGTLLYMLARSIRGAEYRRVRHIVRRLDTASRRRPPRQWWRPPRDV